MKTIMIDAYFAKNFGDDLFIYILLNRYKNQNVKWIINVYDKKYKEIFREFKNIDVIVSNKWKKVLFRNEFCRKKIYKSEVQKVDAMVTIGGSIFMQTPNWKIMMEKFLDRANMYSKNNKKIFLLGANYGPYKDKEFLKKSKELFDLYEDICFRDKYSYEIFKEKKNVRLGSDIVFTLKERSKNKKDIVGISLIGLEEKEELREYKNEYIEKISEIIERITKEGKRVRLFSFCELQGDKNISLEIMEKIKHKELVELIEYDNDIKEFLLRLSEVSTMIGTRFHSLILSQVFSQGMYPIVYSNKTLNILKDMGLSAIYTRIEDIGKSDINEILSKEVENNKLKSLENIVIKAEKQFIALDKYLGRN